MSYDGFISYSHDLDASLVAALQTGLQRLAKPWYRTRALRVFRDDTALSANPHLWSAIQAALDESQWFILLASRDAAASPWVNKELEYWLATKSVERLLPVVTDGEWAWDNAHGDFDAARSSAVPAVLRGRLGDEPRHLDLRWARNQTDLGLRNTRFRDAVADLAAPLHGMDKDELESEEVRQHRHTRRLARAAITSLAVLLVISLAASVFALIQRNDARHQALVATSGQLAAFAAAKATTQPDLALLLAVEGHRLDDTPDTRSSLVTTLAANPALVGLHHQFGSQVWAAAPSPDATHIAIANVDGSLQIWDLATLAPTTPIIHAHHGPVNALAFSPDGRSLVSAGADGTIRVWDSATGQPTSRVLHGDPDGTTALTFSPDGTQFAATGADWTVRRWAMPGAIPLGDHTPLPARNMIFGGPNPIDASYLPDGKTIAVLTTDLAVNFVDATTGVVSDHFVQLSAGGDSIAVSPDGNLLAVGDATGAISLFDLSTLAPHGTPLAGHNGPVPNVTFSADGSQLLSAGIDGTLNVWDVATGTRRRGPLTGHTNPVLSSWFTADGGLESISASEFAIWAPDPRATLGHLVGTSTGPNLLGIAFASTFSPAAGLVAPTGPHTVAVAGHNGIIHFYDTRTGHATPDVIRSGADAGLEIAVSPNHSTLAFEVADGRYPNYQNLRLLIWSLRGRHQQTEIPTPRAEPGLIFRPDGQIIVVTLGGVETLDVHTGKARNLLTKVDISLGPADVALSSNGRVLATVGPTAQLWDARTGKPIGVLKPPPGGVIDAVAFSPTGNLIAAADDKGNVELIDGHSHQVAAYLPSLNHSPVSLMTFSNSGTLLATGNQDGSITLWDVDQRRPIGQPLSGHQDLVLSLAFADHDRALVSSSQDDTLAFRSMDPLVWEAQACAIAGRNLTQAEWHQYMGSRAYHKTCAQWLAGT